MEQLLLVVLYSWVTSASKMLISLDANGSVDRPTSRRASARHLLAPSLSFQQFSICMFPSV